MNFKKLSSLLAVVVFTLGFAGELTASHFRYGTMTWREIGPNKVELTVTSAWRYRSVSPSEWSLSHPGASRTLISRNTYNTGTAYSNQIEKYVLTYSTPGPHTVTWSSCCRIGRGTSLRNNRDGRWRIHTVIDMRNGNDNSPVSSLPVIVNVPRNSGNVSFPVPASDLDGDNLTYRLATSSEMQGTQAPNISIDPSTGVFTVNTNSGNYSRAGDLWNAGVVISDGSSEIIVDFFMQVTNPSTPPVFNYGPTPADAFVYQVSPGTNINFQVQAQDNDPGGFVANLFAAGLPAGASWGNSSGNPATSTFNWTPGVNDFGTYVVNFIAQDNIGVQASSSVTIQVSLKPVFDVPPTPAAGVHTVYTPGDLISYTVQASDPDPTDVVQIVNVQGKDMAGNKIPLYSGASFSSLPSAAANPTSGTFSWQTNAGDWGHKHVFFTARDGFGDEKVHEVSQLINTPPVYTSTPVLNATAGQPYSYTITVSDPDVLYGDVIKIASGALPSWLTLTDNGNGTAVLSGIPGVADAGANAITIVSDDKHHHADPRGVIYQSFSINVITNQAPVAVAQNITVGVDANCSATITAAQVDGGSNDADNDPLTLSIDNAGPFGVGTYTVTLTVDDGQASSTDVATVTVVDNTNPSALVQNVTVALDANGQGSILTSGGSTVVFDGTFTGDANGTTSGNLTNWNITSGSVDVSPFISGATQSIDLAGWSNAKIESNTNISLAPGAYELSFTYKNNDGSPSTSNTFSVALGSAFSKSYTSALYSGNVTITESITVSAAETTTLTFEQTGSNDASGTFLADIALKRITPAGLAINNGSFDNCGLASVVASQVNFTCADLGANNVTLTATDIHGNTGSATAVVTVVDNIAPSAMAQGMTIQLDAAGNASITAAQIDNGSSDNCSVTVSIDKSSFSCADVGANTVTLTATDQSGNSSTATATVTVQDVTAPAMAVQNISINLDAAGNASIAASDIDNGSSDACGIANLSLDVSSFDCSNVGANTVTLTATDVNGNSNTATATVTVNDVTAPVVVTQNVTVSLDANGAGSITVADIENGSSDACGIASSSLDVTSFSCADLGANTVTLTVTDVNGNSNTNTATVTVIDAIDPVISGMPADINVTPLPNDCTPSVPWTAPTASDNCSVTLSSTHNPGDNFAVGSTTVTYTATDQSGNSVSASFVVTITPTPVVVTGITSPTFIGGDNISCFGASDGSIDLSVDGGCEPYTFSWNNNSTSEDLSGLSAGTYSVTITDANGQTATASITLTDPAPVVASASSSGFLSGNGVTGTTLYLGYGPQSINLSSSAVGGHGPYTYVWNNGAGSGANVTVSPTATTTYTVTISDQNGCFDTEQVTVTVLDVRCVPGNSPSSKGKGNKGNGNGRQMKKINVCHNGNTICIDSSAVASHLANHNHGNKSCSLGVCGSSAKNGTAIASALDMHIYPNPTKGIFNVQIHSSEDADIQIILTDIQGRVIAMRSDYVVNGTTEAQFDLSDYANGVYIVKVIGLSEQQVSRLIKD